MMYVTNILIASMIWAYSTYRWKRLGFRFTSPVGLAALLWCLVWAVHLTDVFGYFAVSLRSQFYSLVPIVSLFLGEQAALCFKTRPNMRRHDRKLLSRLLAINAVVAVAFGIVSLVSVYLIFGNPLEEGVGAKIKAARTAAGVAMLRESPAYILGQYVVIARSFVYVSFLSLAALWTLNRPLAIKVAFATVVATLLMDVSWGSRALILDFLIFLFGILAITRRTLRRRVVNAKRLLAIAAMLATVALLAVGANRITESTRPGRSAEVAGVQVPLSVYQLLVWYTSPLVTFDQTLDDNPERTYGLMSGGGLLTVLHMTRLYRNENLPIYDIMYEWETQSPYYKSGSYLDRGNIYTWLRYLYADFGLAGFVTVPFILGFVFGRAAKGVARSSDVDVLGYAILCLAFYIAGRSPIVMAIRPDYVVLALCLVVVTSQLTSMRRASGTGLPYAGVVVRGALSP